MALSTVSDYQVRMNEILYFIETQFGISLGNMNQDNSTINIAPFLDRLIRGIKYNTSSNETTGYTDWKAIIASYIQNYRRTRFNLAGGPGV